MSQPTSRGHKPDRELPPIRVGRRHRWRYLLVSLALVSPLLMVAACGLMILWLDGTPQGGR